MSVTRRASILALLGFVAGCGGGGSGTAPPPMAGTLQTRSIASRSNGTTYPLYIYLPPNSDAIRATLPVVYLLDGESRFQTLVDIAEATQTRVLIVAIGNEALRNRDYVPNNLCTPGGGGEAAFLDFIRLELIPFVEANVGGDPLRRSLLGHSHGGSFVLYALFAEAPAARHFSAYLASDASIDCMSTTVYGWESAYAAANTALAVRLHLSYAANLANVAFALQVQGRRYSGLTFVSQFYAGGHIGMIPMAFADALAFALA
ncbi:MAG: alpha/beta hydrolase [Caldimonas sp.]